MKTKMRRQSWLGIEDSDGLSIRDVIDGANTNRVLVITKEDKIRKEALRLINRYWNSPAEQHKDSFRADIVRFVHMVNKINKSTSIIRGYNGGSIAICTKMDAEKVNTMVHTVNDYLKSNPIHALIFNKKTGNYWKANELKEVSFEGIVMI